MFLHIREIGKEAECAMLRATGGVNTHKGAIFTFGILCAAAGNVYARQGVVRAEDVLACSQRMTSQILHRFGGEGIRGEAIEGFPTLAKAFNLFRQLQKTGASQNSIRLNLLLYIMTELYDTNVISRGGTDQLKWL